jgi:hypothetical protein
MLLEFVPPPPIPETPPLTPPAPPNAELSGSGSSLPEHANAVRLAITAIERFLRECGMIFLPNSRHARGSNGR